MSTNFNVIPATDPPDTGDLLRASQTQIGAFLAARSIPLTVTLHATWFDGDHRLPMDHGPFVWPNGEDSYLWITLGGVPGGTDVAALADDLHAKDDPVTRETVHKWSQRNSIPPRYHAPILRMATTRGIELSADVLVAAHERSRRAA